MEADLGTSGGPTPEDLRQEGHGSPENACLAAETWQHKYSTIDMQLGDTYSVRLRLGGFRPVTLRDLVREDSELIPEDDGGPEQA